MSVNEQPKTGASKQLSKVPAMLKQGVAAIRDQLIGEDCNNCAKSTSSKIEDQHFCCNECYYEFKRKCNACAQGTPLCCLPGCPKPCYYDQERQRYLEFCGRTHGQTFKQERRDTQLYAIVRTQCGGHFQLHSYSRPTQGTPAYHHSSGNKLAPFATTHGYHSTASAGGVHTRTSPSTCATNQPIYFYHSWQPYFEFTNFSAYPIQIADKQWPTSEHFFQAQKFIGTPLVEKVRKCHTPREAFDISRSELGAKWLRKDWSEEKENVMKLALRAKFTQHQFLHDLLLSTGDRKLVEHTDRDSFWGDGGDGHGQNKLGLMLMELRQELKRNELHLNFIFPYSRWEATQGTLQGASPHPPSEQPTTPSQNAQHSHTSQSRSQAPQLHGNCGRQHEGRSTEDSYQSRQRSYSEVLKNQSTFMDWQSSGH